MTTTECDELDRRAMARLVGGHEASLNDLMERHGQPLFIYLVRLLGNETEAEDLAQETFVRVYLHRDRFRPDAKFSTWLYTIATNLGRDRLRWRGRHPQVSLDAATTDGTATLGDTLPSTNPGPDEALHADERVVEIRRAVATLPEDLRVSLVLAEYEELSQAEIAEILGCSIKAVEMRIYRARQALRKELAGLMKDAG
jgi:RNA polymerase sigma-70 factor (ECF subfamily)